MHEHTNTLAVLCCVYFIALAHSFPLPLSHSCLLAYSSSASYVLCVCMCVCKMLAFYIHKTFTLYNNTHTFASVSRCLFPVSHSTASHVAALTKTHASCFDAKHLVSFGRIRVYKVKLVFLAFALLPVACCLLKNNTNNNNTIVIIIMIIIVMKNEAKTKTETAEM